MRSGGDDVDDDFALLKHLLTVGNECRTIKGIYVSLQSRKDDDDFDCEKGVEE